VTRTFELANHLWSHPVFESFWLVFALIEITIAIPVYFYVSLLHAVFKYLISYLGEKFLDITKHHTIPAVFFEQSYYVSFTTLFNKVLKVP